MFRRRFTRRVGLALLLLLTLAAGRGPAAADNISVVSFNIKFVGLYADKRNADLADLLSPYDLVFVQELVAPPYAGFFPDGTPFKPAPRAKAFFDEMSARGFSFLLSEEDTGAGLVNHLNSSATEWFVAFFKWGRVTPDLSIPHGFLAADRSHNPDFERVPYAFGFRAGQSDLVFISVHLAQGSGPAARKRRQGELMSIASWIAVQPRSERDYVILGDMNLQNCVELHAVSPTGYRSLNDDCRSTNTNPTGPKPFDHVMYRPDSSGLEIDEDQGLAIINLVETMKSRWTDSLGPYPGQPYSGTLFPIRYSDHAPIVFHVRTDRADDD
jgi:hypothetical protein